jgi:hypothetical protein
LTFHPDILSIRQKKVLTQIGHFCSTRGFYLAGGTALAIHLGHRRSGDFDWFTHQSIPDPLLLAEDIRKVDIPFTTTQVERGTGSPLTLKQCHQSISKKLTMSSALADFPLPERHGR